MSARDVVGHPAHYPDLEPCTDRDQHLARLTAQRPAQTPIAERPAAVKDEHRCSSAPCLHGRIGAKR